MLEDRLSQYSYGQLAAVDLGQAVLVQPESGVSWFGHLTKGFRVAVCQPGGVAVAACQ